MVIYPLQRSITPRRRTAAWVGKPRIKLAERIDKVLAEMGINCVIEAEHIRPAQGYWRTTWGADVLRIEGQIKVQIDGNWFTTNLESWASVTDLLKHGFDAEVSVMGVELMCHG